MSSDLRGESSPSRGSLAWGLRILDSYLANPHRNWTVGALAEELGASLPTTYRIVNALLEAGFLEREGPRQPLRLGIKIARLGHFAQASWDTRTKARPELEHLAALTGETATLQIVGSDGAICIDHVEGTSPIRPASRAIGDRIPYNAGAGAIALLAYQTEERQEQILAASLPAATEATITSPEAMRERCDLVRRTGISFSAGEAIEGTAAIAAPFFDLHGACRGVITITGVVERIRPDEVAPPLRQSVARISHSLGWEGAPGTARSPDSPQVMAAQ